MDCIIVSRFDRRSGADGAVLRVHQEDLGQALPRDPEAQGRRGNYQRFGGPSLAEAAGILDQHAADPVAELDRLVAAATFTVLVGNADNHGRNVAFLHQTAATVRLAPLYDTVPTVLWPELRTKSAGAGASTTSVPSPLPRRRPAGPTTPGGPGGWRSRSRKRLRLPPAARCSIPPRWLAAWSPSAPAGSSLPANRGATL